MIENIKQLGKRNSGPVEVKAPTLPEHVGRPQGDGDAQRVCFLSGHARSGTNWVGSLLALHPKVHVRGEYHFEALLRGFDDFFRREWHVASGGPAREVAERYFIETVRQTILATAHEKPSATWLCDQTPRRIMALVPGARHITVVRDPRDVIVSWTYHVLRCGPEVVPAIVEREQRGTIRKLMNRYKKDADHFERHPEELLDDEQWVRHMARGWATMRQRDRETIRLMEAGELDGRAMEINYEDLRGDLATHRPKLYEFLDLDPGEADAPSSETKTSAGFERTDTKSFYRAGVAGGWMKYMHERCLHWVWDAAGEEMEHAGYTLYQPA